MRVFKNKILKSFKGRGSSKDDADVNYSLMPQPDGNFLRSTDFLSSLDLLCEGEIEGFVNPEGALLNGVDVLQAVYLNDVPVLEVESYSSATAKSLVDLTGPTIIIVGDNPQIIELGVDSFVDEGAFADNGEAVSVISNVDDQVVGSYTVTYSATDASGNTSTATRVVNVIEKTAPVITILGSNPLTIQQGTVYTDAGATSDGGETITVINGNIDTSVPNRHQVIYFATDASGNTGTAIRLVSVIDTVPPVITVLGDNPLLVVRDSTYTDPGATSDGNEFVSINNAVNMSAEGIYTVTYSATDASGNTGTATRTVEVIGDNIVTFSWGRGSFNTNTWTYDPQENRWEYIRNSGPTNYIEKTSNNRWKFYGNINLNRPSGTVEYITNSSYTSDVPINIPHSDWRFVGQANSSSSAAKVGFLLLESDIPSSGSTITLQGFYPDGSGSSGVDFNGTYRFDSNNFTELTYTKTDSTFTYTIKLSRNGANFRWIAYYTGSGIWFWSDDFDPDADINNILDITLGGLINKISTIHPSFPQPVIGTVS